MHEVPAAEVEARLAELLRRAERGEEIAITRDGRAVARLSPAHPDDPAPLSPAERSAAVRRFIEERKKLEPLRMTVDEILAARHEGHRA